MIVSDNSVLWRIFGPNNKRKEIKETWRISQKRGFKIVTFI
jgi:hypothetical protein